MQDAAHAVEMRGITKLFGSFCALDSVDLMVKRGSIHSLLGENGAGKSTLMNILYGLYQADGGEILLRGKPVTLKSPADAIAAGIGMVHQHFMLVENFTVTENILLGSEITGGLGLLKRRAERQAVVDLSERYGLHVDPDALIEDISVGMQQRVEILKALYRGAEILILDEPTAVLTPQEIEELIGIMRKLVSTGKTIIIITHKLKEIKEASDACTIIRRGKTVGTVDVADASVQALADRMVGRTVDLSVEKTPANPTDVVLAMKDVVLKDNRGVERLKKLNLTVRRGEIVGVAGIDGNGQKELVEALMSLSTIESGSIAVNGAAIHNTSPRNAIERRVSVIHEDRHRRGLVLDFTVAENFVLETYRKPPFSHHGLLDLARIDAFAEQSIEAFDVRPAGCERMPMRALSGGNQQKVIIGREVQNQPDLLIAAQPTRGLDVGAIEFVHRSLIEQRDAGRAVLLISFELDEVMDVADTIVVLYDGHIVGTFQQGEVDEGTLGLYMAGGRASA